MAKEAIMQMFQRYDTEGDGTIDKSHMASILKSIGGFTEGQLDKLFVQCTSLSGGRLRYEDFVDMLGIDNSESTQKRENEIELLKVELSKANNEITQLRAALTAKDDNVELESASNYDIMFKDSKVRGERRKKGACYDLIVLGGGPCGLKAAIEAAYRGQYVALIEAKEHVDGLPTGAHSKCLREAALMGATTWAEVEAKLQSAVANKRAEVVKDIDMYGVRVLTGFGTVLDARRVRFTPKSGETARELEFETLLIATGSKANRFPPLTDVFDKVEGVFDSDTIQSISYLPKRIVIQGAGIIGFEYAMIFVRLGAEKVTIVEIAGQAVPFLDVSLQEECMRLLKAGGQVEILFNTKITGVETTAEHDATSPSLLVGTDDESKTSIPCDCLLSCTGRSGCSAGIGLENLEPLGLKIGRGKMIEADENGATGAKNVFAVGDVAGANLATNGQAQAMRMVRANYCLARNVREEPLQKFKPSGIWTIPEIAWVGLTEQDAKKEYDNVGIATAQYKQTVRGCVSDEDGVLKLVYDRDNGCVLGVHLCGENACDLINYGGELVNAAKTIFDILQFVFPAVTYHQLYHFAAIDAKQRLKGAIDLKADMLWKRLKGSCMSRGSQEELESIANKAFLEFDVDKSGFITPKEMHEVICSLGIVVTLDEIHVMIREVAGQDKTFVDYGQFIERMTG